MPIVRASAHRPLSLRRLSAEGRGVRPLFRSECCRFAAAMREKPRPAPRALPAPTTPAPGRDPCEHCGVPGFKGCAHYLPCEPVDPASIKPDRHKDGRGSGDGLNRRYSYWKGR